MNFKLIGAQIGKAIDREKGAEIGKAIGLVFEKTIPLIIQNAVEEAFLKKDEIDNSRSIEAADAVSKNKIGFTINDERE